MRIAESIEEKYIVCPECKRLLAYVDSDVRKPIKHDASNKLFKISNYIDCPVCGYSNLISYEECSYNT